MSDRKTEQAEHETQPTPARAYLSARVAVMAPLGFASGLPSPLVGGTLAAWLRSEGVDLKTIGALALASVPYNLKFVWAPLLDRFALPWLGRRRGWMALLQLTLLCAIGLLGMFDPHRGIVPLAALALLTAFLSASYDIVVDAYRTDVLSPSQRASGTAVFLAGYRGALIVAGAGALMLSDHMSWSAVYWLLAAMTVLGFITSATAPAPGYQVARPPTLGSAFVEPLREIWGRRGARLALTVVTFYKIGDVVASGMLTPFLIDLGVSRTEIGAVQKGLGLVASIVGSLLAGGAVARFGLRSCLLGFGGMQAAANVLYIALARAGYKRWLLVTAVGTDSLCGGLGMAAFVAYLMSLCDHRYTAFQYALLSSLSTVSGRLLAGGGGWIAERWGWSLFFALTIGAALPALALLWRFPLAPRD